MTPEQAAKAILESLTTLDPEQYRMGHTKVRLSLWSPLAEESSKHLHISLFCQYDSKPCHLRKSFTLFLSTQTHNISTENKRCRTKFTRIIYKIILHSATN